MKDYLFNCWVSNAIKRLICLVNYLEEINSPCRHWIRENSYLFSYNTYTLCSHVSKSLYLKFKGENENGK